MYTIDEEKVETEILKMGEASNFDESKPIYQPLRKKAGKKWLLILIVLIIVLVIAGWSGFIFKHPQPTPTPAPTPTATSVPTPTPNPLIRSEWSFEVLNGSGVTGLAKKVADKINGLGYSVVKTGNADKDNYAKTQIFVKVDLKKRLDLVIADLKDAVKIASYSGELKDSTASARIILGKDL